MEIRSDLRVTGSLPALDYRTLEAAETALGLSLPADYREFLLAHNGGFAKAGPRCFAAPIAQVRGEVRTSMVKDAVAEFFGVGELAADGPAPSSLLALDAKYRAEEFLPSDVVVVARCETGSLICLGTRPGTCGQVFYWYYYWRYPWAVGHFEEALAAAERRHPDAERTLHSSGHPAYQEVSDALNYATLTRVAPSFGAFLAGLAEEEAALT